MGLFSSSNKNKQDRVAEDSGRFYSKDDDAALGEQARAKRASSAGAKATAARRSANDPLLPEKKRARRRLVGAIALALAAAVGLPMLLDSEPKPLAGDIAIKIPPKEKAAPLPVPGDKPVAAEDTVDRGEEVVAPPPVARVETAKPEVTPEVKADLAKAAEHKDTKEAKEREARAERKDKQDKLDREARLAERERADRERAEKDRADKERADRERADKLAKAKAEEKAAKAREDARAQAILEGKSGAGEKGADKTAEKTAEKPKAAESATQKFVLQVAALSSAEKAAEVQAKLRDAGIASYTQKASTPSGELIRVRVGPLSREDAEKVRAKLGKLGLSGAMTPV